MTQRLPVGYRAESALEVRRSRFVATLARADDEAAARTVVANLRHRHPEAQHHCSAFILEVAGAQPIERSSDDGEPSGTAGMPMLDVLRASGLSNVVAVVVRWFGGTKLGTGGLVRAYSDAVAAVLDGVPRVEVAEERVWRVVVDHADAGRLQGELLNRGVDVVAAEYSPSGVVLGLSHGDDRHLAALVARLTQGRAILKPAGTRESERPL